MSINIVEAVQSKLGYPPLHKIDPNTQEIINDNRPVNLLAQGAIPAFLIGMYKLANSKVGAEDLVRGSNSSLWATQVFGDNRPAVIEQIATYANTSTEDASAELDKVAGATQQVLLENVKNPDGKALRSFFADQVASLKKYLPPALQLGKALHDNTIDDRTNKMSGPFSNHMHWLEKLFSDAGNQKDPNNPSPVDPTIIH